MLFQPAYPKINLTKQVTLTVTVIPPSYTFFNMRSINGIAAIAGDY